MGVENLEKWALNSSWLNVGGKFRTKIREEAIESGGCEMMCRQEIVHQPKNYHKGLAAARPAIVKPSDQPPAQTMILFIRPFVSEAAVIIEHTYMGALASKLFGCTDCEGDGLIVARAVTVLSDP